MKTVRSTSLIISIAVCFTLLSSCSENSVHSQVEFTPMAAFVRPENLALNDTCLSAWFDACELSMFPEKDSRWNSKLVEVLQLLISQGCVNQPTLERNYSTITEFTAYHRHALASQSTKLLEWRRKHTIPPWYVTIYADVFGWITNSPPAETTYGLIPYLEFRSIVDRINFHHRRAGILFQRNILDDSAALIPEQHLESLLQVVESTIMEH